MEMDISSVNKLFSDLIHSEFYPKGYWTKTGYWGHQVKHCDKVSWRYDNLSGP